MFTKMFSEKKNVCYYVLVSLMVLLLFLFSDAINSENESYHGKNRHNSMIEYGYTCTAEQLQRINQSDAVRESNCPNRDTWMSFIYNSTSTISKSSPGVLINIGCNKGKSHEFKSYCTEVFVLSDDRF